MAVRERGRSKRFLLGAKEEQWRKLAWLVINRGDNGFEGGGGGSSRRGGGWRDTRRQGIKGMAGVCGCH